MSHADLLALTDAELETIMAAAAPIDRQRRDAFLRDVAAELKRCPEVGPGLVARVCRALQRKHFDPPHLDHPPQQLRKLTG